MIYDNPVGWWEAGVRPPPSPPSCISTAPVLKLKFPCGATSRLTTPHQAFSYSPGDPTFGTDKFVLSVDLLSNQKLHCSKVPLHLLSHQSNQLTDFTLKFTLHLSLLHHFETNKCMRN